MRSTDSFVFTRSLVPPMHLAAACLLLLLCGGISRTAAARSSRASIHLANETALRRSLFRDYDAKMAGDWPVTVEFELVVVSVSSLDAMLNLVVLETWWRIRWRDERLVWDASAYDGIDSLMVDQSSVRARARSLDRRRRHRRHAAGGARPTARTAVHRSLEPRCGAGWRLKRVPPARAANGSRESPLITPRARTVVSSGDGVVRRASCACARARVWPSPFVCLRARGVCARARGAGLDAGRGDVGPSLGSAHHVDAVHRPLDERRDALAERRAASLPSASRRMRCPLQVYSLLEHEDARSSARAK